MSDKDDLETLVAAVMESAKYRHITPEVIRRVGARELATRPNLKAAIKETKNTLHQVAGAFQEKPIDYGRALDDLRAGFAAAGGDIHAEPFRAACRRVMALHTSTRERLPILDTFYATTLAGLDARTILDVACGLNPLARPWMPIGPEVVYRACDIYTDQVAFLNDAFRLMGVAGEAFAADVVAADSVVAAPPDEPVDLALVLKTLPCLEAADRNAPTRLLDGLNARRLLVSFPAQSLGGRRKGQAAHYEARFLALIAERGWAYERFEFATELAFLVEKGVRG